MGTFVRYCNIMDYIYSKEVLKRIHLVQGSSDFTLMNLFASVQDSA